MKRRLIALVGHAGVGKDTVAERMQAKRFAFAEPLKKFCQEVFAFSHEQAFGQSANRNAIDPRYNRADGVPLTPRHAMQTLGTEWGRAMHPNIWAEFGVRRAVEYLKDAPYGQGLAVITDCRFINEAEEVRKHGGEVWRVVRPNHVLPPEVANHPSETEQDTEGMNRLINRVVLNKGTIEELSTTVAAMVDHFLAVCRDS